jgi:hypothetical protein
MFDYLLNDEQKQLKQQAREFVKTIPRQMIRDMEEDAQESSAADEKIFE